MAVSFTGQAARYATTGLATGGVVSLTPTYLLHVSCINTNAATRYIQFFNSITVPADTAVPVLVLLVPATSHKELALQDVGIFFSTGLSWCLSTTLPTKTLGAAEAWMEVLYVPRRT